MLKTLRYNKRLHYWIQLNINIVYSNKSFIEHSNKNRKFFSVNYEILFANKS